MIGLISNLPPIILASASPRRAEILRTLGLEFEVIHSNVDENAITATITNPKTLAETLSRLKCEAIAKDRPNHLVIGADTVVTQNGTLYGKPENTNDAIRMLTELQGGPHHVITGITLMHQNKHISRTPCTTVHVVAMSPDDIAAYVATGDPLDKAGAYGIQGRFAPFISHIEGCYFNVVGLSPFALCQAIDSVLDPL